VTIILLSQMLVSERLVKPARSARTRPLPIAGHHLLMELVARLFVRPMGISTDIALKQRPLRQRIAAIQEIVEGRSIVNIASISPAPMEPLIFRIIVSRVVLRKDPREAINSVSNS